MRVEPYLFFEGRCAEAIEFYKTALGAEVLMMMRFKEAPPSPDSGSCPPGMEDNVMHAAIKVGDTTVMASDGMGNGNPTFQGVSLSLTAADDAEAERVFAALEDGGKVTQPLVQTFFSSRFGMVADRFGVHWMIVVMQ